MYSILVENGHVIDGTGAPRFRADVALQGDRIAQIGQLEGMAETVIDATGCVVTPGFVDMHSHADFTLPIRPTADSMVHQGITTAVIGQCGASPAPLLDETREQVLAMMEGGENPLPWEEWSTFGDYLGYLRRIGISINVVPLSTKVLNLPQIPLATLGGWLVIAIAAVAVVFVVLKIVGKAVAASLRMAIILGSLVVIALSLFVLSMLLNGGKLPSL